MIPKLHRNVYWKEEGWISSSIFDRTQLCVDQLIEGPAIIEEYGSTTVVPKYWNCIVDKYKNLILRKME